MSTDVLLFGGGIQTELIPFSSVVHFCVGNSGVV